MDRKPLVLASEYSPLVWIVRGIEPSMVRDRAGVWSPGLAMPQTSFDMICLENDGAFALIREAQAALDADPTLATALPRALT